MELQGNIDLIVEAIRCGYNNKSYKLLSDFQRSFNQEEKFIIYEGWKIDEAMDQFNNWIKEFHPELVKELEEESRHDIGRVNSSWFDYITEDNWGFSDSYVFCEECGEVIDKQPYGKPNGLILDRTYCWLCADCIKETYAEDYLEELIDNPRKANYFLDLEDFGFTKVDKEYENGWYGVNDNPQEIYAKIKEEAKEYTEVVFDVTSINPFATYFTVWTRTETE